MLKIFQFLIASALIHAAVVAGVAWVLSATGREKVIATLDLSSVELSFAEEEREVAPNTVPTVSSRPGANQAVSKAVPVPSVEMPRADDGVAVPPTPPTPEIASREPLLEKMELVDAAGEDAPRYDAAPSVPAAAPRQAHVDAPRRPQRVIRPDYPRAARQRGEQGDVVLEIDVAADGSVASVAVATSSGFADLDAAALKAVKSARFSPAKSGDRAVASHARLTLSFKLK